MKTALLHYWLLHMRGGEQVFAEICDLFPGAEIYTHAARPEKLSAAITAHGIHESFIAGLPGGRNHVQWYLPLMFQALRRWNFAGCDLIVSSESGPVKGIRKPAGCRHLCYCHTPMRYLWDLYDDYFGSAGWGGRLAMRLTRDALRRADLESAENVDRFIANSNFVAERIRRIYGRAAAVVHPPVDVDFFGAAPQLERRHYLWAGELVCYKHPELAVEAFRRLSDQTLLVAGTGPMLKVLEKNAPPNVRFLHHVNRAGLRELYASARGLIFPGVEDFGMVMVEALAAGCPVIAADAGGAREIVRPGQNGILFEKPSATTLCEAVEALSGRRWDAEVIRRSAAGFGRGWFRAGFRRELHAMLGREAEL